ncbi:hypothetical protein F2P81_025191 [Scophthalmus maximus]|uniref:Uncharacterized protein n=1 Tax=Scophthalmus maximus TaxID=52904 RepID=A0A6A4RR00_SCOMX|nr:hypothetical protein F2P81_025191 [Scophthalmus maximus]
MLMEFGLQPVKWTLLLSELLTWTKLLRLFIHFLSRHRSLVRSVQFVQKCQTAVSRILFLRCDVISCHWRSSQSTVVCLHSSVKRYEDH